MAIDLSDGQAFDIILPKSVAGAGAQGGGGIGIDGLNIPSKPQAPNDAKGGNDQRSRRFTDTMYDIHRTSSGGRFPQGRPWTGERELAANPDKNEPPGFIGPLNCGAHVTDDAGNVLRRETFASVWHAPWLPKDKWFRYDYKRNIIRFDYAGMLLEHQQSYDRYYEAAAVLGAELNIGVEYGQMPHFQITAKIGRPTTEIPLIQAAMAGDPWLLGFIDEPNADLAKLLGMTERGFGRPKSFTPEPKVVATPEQVLATPQNELLRMLADMSAKMDAQAAEIAEMKAKAAQSQKIKDGMAKAKAKTSAPAGEAA